MVRARETVNVTRMSIAVHANLENDEGGNYAAATAGEGRSEVQLHDADAELDFEERQAEEGAQKLGPLWLGRGPRVQVLAWV